MDICWFKVKSLNTNQEIHKSQTNTLWSTESEIITSSYYCFFQCNFCQLKPSSPWISKAGQRDFLKMRLGTQSARLSKHGDITTALKSFF